MSRPSKTSRGSRHFSDLHQHVARRLRAARLTAGVSQETAGKHLGITFQQVQKYENGANRVSAGSLGMLAQLYKVPVGWFFEGVLEGATNGGDLSAEFLSVTHGADLARDFISIKDPISRGVVASVAHALRGC